MNIPQQQDRAGSVWDAQRSQKSSSNWGQVAGGDPWLWLPSNRFKVSSSQILGPCLG